MDSGQNSSPQNNVPNLAGLSKQGRVDAIKRGIPDGETPMDIINAITQRDAEPFNPQKSADDIMIRRQEERENEPSPFEKLPDPLPTKIETPAPNPNAPKMNIEADASSIPEEPLEDFDPNALLVSKDSTAENFKKLRTKYTETKKVLREKEEALENVQKELTSYTTGEKVPDYVFQNQKRIEELERYEKLHSLKTSREYVEKVVRPIEEKKNRLIELGKESEVPAEVLEQGINKKGRDLNRFLEDHFDTLDALEAKRVIQEIQGITEYAREIELEPAKVLQDLQTEQAEVHRQQEQSRVSTIANKSRKGWTDAISFIRQEGKVQELIERPNDSKHNEQYVEPILRAAASEYGKIVARLGELGLKDLPDDLAFALSRMTQLAHASAVSVETRQKAVSTVETMLKNVQRRDRYARPPVGDAQGGGSGPTLPKRETREDRVNALLDHGMRNPAKA